MKKFNINKQCNRNSLRLKDYDYSQNGAYFITICTNKKKVLFGRIENNKVSLNEYGKVVEFELIRSAEIGKEIEIDNYIVMPNHIHGIVVIDREYIENNENNRANGRSPLQMIPKSVSSFIAGFKSAAAKRINVIRNIPRSPV